MAAPEVRFLQGDEIERMTRGELQALAKAHGLKANRKNADLVAALQALMRPGAEAQPGDGAGSAPCGKSGSAEEEPTTYNDMSAAALVTLARERLDFKRKAKKADLVRMLEDADKLAGPAAPTEATAGAEGASNTQDVVTAAPETKAGPRNTKRRTTVAASTTNSEAALQMTRRKTVEPASTAFVAINVPVFKGKRKTVAPSLRQLEAEEALAPCEQQEKRSARAQPGRRDTVALAVLEPSVEESDMPLAPPKKSRRMTVAASKAAVVDEELNGTTACNIRSARSSVAPQALVPEPPQPARGRRKTAAAAALPQSVATVDEDTAERTQAAEEEVKLKQASIKNRRKTAAPAAGRLEQPASDQEPAARDAVPKKSRRKTAAVPAAPAPAQDEEETAVPKNGRRMTVAASATASQARAHGEGVASPLPTKSRRKTVMTKTVVVAKRRAPVAAAADTDSSEDSDGDDEPLDATQEPRHDSEASGSRASTSGSRRGSAAATVAMQTEASAGAESAADALAVTEEAGVGRSSNRASFTRAEAGTAVDDADTEDGKEGERKTRPSAVTRKSSGRSSLPTRRRSSAAGPPARVGDAASPRQGEQPAGLVDATSKPGPASRRRSSRLSAGMETVSAGAEEEAGEGRHGSLVESLPTVSTASPRDSLRTLSTTGGKRSSASSLQRRSSVGAKRSSVAGGAGGASRLSRLSLDSLPEEELRMETQSEAQELLHLEPARLPTRRSSQASRKAPAPDAEATDEDAQMCAGGQGEGEGHRQDDDKPLLARRSRSSGSRRSRMACEERDAVTDTGAAPVEPQVEKPTISSAKKVRKKIVTAARAGAPVKVAGGAVERRAMGIKGGVAQSSAATKPAALKAVMKRGKLPAFNFDSRSIFNKRQAAHPVGRSTTVPIKPAAAAAAHKENHAPNNRAPTAAVMVSKKPEAKPWASKTTGDGSGATTAPAASVAGAPKPRAQQTVTEFVVAPPRQAGRRKSSGEAFLPAGLPCFVT